MTAIELFNQLYNGDHIEGAPQITGVKAIKNEMICGCDGMNECAECDV